MGKKSLSRQHSTPRIELCGDDSRYGFTGADYFADGSGMVDRPPEGDGWIREIRCEMMLLPIIDRSMRGFYVQ